MLIVLSPAKSLDYCSALPTTAYTQPDFLDEAQQLVDVLKRKSPAELSALMSISDELAGLNAARYAEWARPFDPISARPAVFAFDGDVYDGLGARSLDRAGLDFAQRHLRVLSGLYGVLKPLDLMRPYRLEMGTRLANARGKDLYAFWGDTPTQALGALLEKQAIPVLVNLASEEYFKVVRPAKLEARLVQPVFEDYKSGRYKVVSFFAKRARGLMTRYAIDHRLEDVETLKDFDCDGYRFDPAASSEDKWVFRRRMA